MKNYERNRRTKQNINKKKHYKEEIKNEDIVDAATFIT